MSCVDPTIHVWDPYIPSKKNYTNKYINKCGCSTTAHKITSPILFGPHQVKENKIVIQKVTHVTPLPPLS